MGFNRFNIKVVFYILCFVSLSILGTRSFYDEQYIMASFYGIVAVIISFIFVNYLNETNRKIAYFVDAVKNEDSSLKFPENIKNKSIKILHEALNKVNELITDTKIKAEHREKFYEALIEHSATGLISINEHGEFEILNNTARKYLGVEHTSNLKRLQQNNKTLYDIFTSIKPGKTMITRLFVDNEYFHLSVRCTEIKYFEKRYKLISLHNIRYELEEKEMESWQKLFRVITHEIMNSIAPITSVSNTLSGYFKKGEKVVPCEGVTQKIIANTVQGLEVIEDMSNGLINFVNSYRSLNKIPKPVFKPIQSISWLKNVQLLTEKMTEDGRVNISFEVKNGFEFQGDEQLLNQVMINLIKNAVQVLENQDNRRIIIQCFQDPANKIFIEIEDNGPGIDSSDLEQIFVPFYTTKEKGTGIGLSLCRQIVRVHNGNLWVRSKKGEGSVFVIGM